MRKLLQSRRRPLPARPQEEDIVLSCRVRLARNLAGTRFPDWNDEDGHFGVLDTIFAAVERTGALPAPSILGARDRPPDPQELALLHEQHVVSKELVDRGRGGALIRCSDPGASIMVNEEDHLRIQVIRPGLELASAWAMADRIDTCLESALDYAFSPQLGYLTACPSNVGTGLRASFMVNLLGLRLAEDLDAALRALAALRLTVRGVDGEGTDAAGHLFQISNQGTLGEREDEVVQTLSEQVGELIRQEHFARRRLLRDTPAVVHDCVARALAILQHARMIASDEAMDYLSALRLGRQLRLLKNLDVARIDALLLGVQPVHLSQRFHLETVDQDCRDRRRADWLRQELADVLFLA
jgi:protein arginine kinase